ncbi:haloacid dehalogenase-like hydrolase [gut metagenome]|uniref:Haloacid dehalogenase-like hydrolase n=1 Tax=gut metagenome TaxID=749906 RepID=J9FLL1_9ZZZZ
MIKNLIFDFGKVLVDYDFEAFFTRHIPDAQRRMEVGRIFNTPQMQDLFDREAVPFDEQIAALVSQHPQYAQEIRFFDAHYPDLVTGEVPGMRELLTRLKAEGFRLYGLTNWCSKVYETIDRYAIFDLLEGYIISSEEHYVKPEPEIYQCLFDRFGLQPEECIFTDDKAVNIEGGERLGMSGIVFHNAQDYEQKLREMLAR